MSQGRQTTMLDECKAVLSRLGLYRHMAPDDHHMDQFKPHSGSARRKAPPGDELTVVTVGMSMSPAGPGSPIQTDDAMQLVEDRSETRQYGSDHSNRDQHPQQPPLVPTTPFSSGMPHPSPLRMGSGILQAVHADAHPHSPRRFSTSSESSASMGSWDVNAHESRGSVSPRAYNPSLHHQHQHTHADKYLAETHPTGTLHAKQVMEHTGYQPATVTGSPVQQVMMYVSATGEPLGRLELEQHALAMRGAGVGMGAPPTPKATTPPQGHQLMAGQVAQVAGLKRLHSSSIRAMDSALPRRTSMGGSVMASALGATASLPPLGLASPTPNITMRRSSRPACVPGLDLSVLPGVDCDSPLYVQRAGGAHSTPNDTCQYLDSAEEDRAELESWAAPARWFPSSEGRHYVFKPVNGTEIRRYERLQSALPPDLGSEVSRMWNSLIEARYACELMASRGVRVVKDVTREWSEMSSHLIQRIEAHESAASDMQAYCQQQHVLIQQLTYQLKLAQAAATHSPLQSHGGWSGSGYGHEDNSSGGGAMTALPSDLAMLQAAGAHALRQPRRADRGGMHGGPN